MTIHHDKLAYGKISSLVDEFSEERLAEMAEALSEEEEECDKENEYKINRLKKQSFPESLLNSLKISGTPVLCTECCDRMTY